MVHLTDPAFDLQLVRRGIPPKALKRRTTMNVVSLHEPLPIDVTFFIGPIESPPEFKEAYQENYQKAVEQSAAGNTDLLDEMCG